MSLTLQTAPATEPITTAEAKTHLRVDGTDDDTYIDTLVASARRWVEDYTGRALVTQTWDWKFDHFPVSNRAYLWLPKGPVSAITSITYLDTDGASQTMTSSDYVLDGDHLPPRVALAPSADWPDTEADRINTVTVRFVAGYGAASSVPDDIKHAVKLLVGQLYAHREPEVVGHTVSRIQFALDSLLSSHRLWY
jgi:uncharacterized phiE125 gp8 family phage protein